MFPSAVNVMRLDGGQLTADLSDEIRLAMGVARQHKKQRIQEAEAAEAMRASQCCIAA